MTLKDFRFHFSVVLREYQIDSKYNDKQKKKREKRKERVE
jgi:hypothetical protein